MKSSNRSPKSKQDFRNSPEFYEELALIKAQDLIAELLAKSGMSKSELAKKLGQSKAHVTELLSGERNLTIRTLAKLCFHLGSEVVFGQSSLDAYKCANAVDMVIHQNTGEITAVQMKSWKNIRVEEVKPDKLDAPNYAEASIGQIAFARGYRYATRED